MASWPYQRPFKYALLCPIFVSSPHSSLCKQEATVRLDKTERVCAQIRILGKAQLCVCVSHFMILHVSIEHHLYFSLWLDLFLINSREIWSFVFLSSLLCLFCVAWYLFIYFSNPFPPLFWASFHKGSKVQWNVAGKPLQINLPLQKDVCVSRISDTGLWQIWFGTFVRKIYT